MNSQKDLMKPFRQIFRQTGLQTDFQKTGYLLAVGEGQEKMLTKNVSFQKRMGVDVRLQRPDELKRMQPDPKSIQVSISRSAEQILPTLETSSCSLVSSL